MRGRRGRDVCVEGCGEEVQRIPPCDSCTLQSALLWDMAFAIHKWLLLQFARPALPGRAAGCRVSLCECMF